MTIVELFNELKKTQLANYTWTEGSVRSALYVGAMWQSWNIPVLDIDVIGRGREFRVTQLTISHPATFPALKSYRMDDQIIQSADIVDYLVNLTDEVLWTIEQIKSTWDMDADAATLWDCGFKANHYPENRELYQFAGHAYLEDDNIIIRVVFPDSTYETPLQWVSVISDTRTYNIVDRYECNTLAELLIYIGG